MIFKHCEHKYIIWDASFIIQLLSSIFWLMHSNKQRDHLYKEPDELIKLPTLFYLVIFN